MDLQSIHTKKALVSAVTVVAVISASLLLPTAFSAGVGSRGSAATSSQQARGAASSPLRRASILKGTGVIRWGDTFIEPSHYGRYAYVFVSRHNAAAAAKLPGVSLVYTSAASIQSSWSTGVTYAAAARQGWLLRDTSGNPLLNTGYGASIADVGDRGYQRRFVANTVAYVTRTKVDGVFIDDVVGNFVGLTGGAIPAKYATQQAWETAMVSFISYVGPALKSRGIYVVANAAMFVPGDNRSDTGELTAAFWRRLGRNVSGLTTEYWLQAPTNTATLRSIGSDWTDNWPGWQGLVSVAQQSGADFFGLMYGSGENAAAMRFGRGSFLLDWDGAGGAFMYAIDDRADPRHPGWVAQFGKPVAAKLERGVGVWQRRYQQGYVVVNAGDAAVTIRVAGKARVIPPLDAIFVRAKPVRS